MSAPTLVFDVGGVFVKLGGMRQFTEWTGLTPNEIKARWLSSPPVREFESGRMSFDRFAAEVIREFDLPIGPDDLRVEMHAWTGELFDGAHELLAEVTTAHHVVCLCNSNAIQWPLVRDELGLGRFFARQFVSHELGLVKPQPELFHYVTRELGKEAPNIVFFDDSHPNVDGAKHVGWDAHHVNGVDELRAALVRLGFL